MTEATAKLLTERAGVRIAMMVVAAPVLCCALGLIVLTWLKHRQASLAAQYAARHLVPWPAATGHFGEPSSYLHGAGPGWDVLVRNPAQWPMDIGMTSFALTPLLAIALTVTIYGAVTRNRTAVFAGAVPFAGLLWTFSAPAVMIAQGRELMLDAAHDRLTLNGAELARLSDIAGFEAHIYHHAKGGDDFLLSAFTRAGKEIALQGPDDRADMIDAAAPLNAMLRRLRGEASGS